MGNNERGWARLVSSFGRVVLIQQGILQHVEVWENGQATYQGPEVSVMSTRKLDEMTFSMLTMRYGQRHPLGRNFRAPDRMFKTGPCSKLAGVRYRYG